MSRRDQDPPAYRDLDDMGTVERVAAVLVAALILGPLLFWPGRRVLVVVLIGGLCGVIGVTVWGVWHAV